MIFTSYCDDPRIAPGLEEDRRSMSVEDQVEMEELLQRWGHPDYGTPPEPAHIYLEIDDRYRIVARRERYSKRFLVGVHDLENQEIVVVSMARGPIRKAVQPAFVYLRIQDTPHRNPEWTG
jgi:hypothetical protein